jgi:hypothetical protein
VAASITPDTKDWTWVLRRPCPDCGFDTRQVRREAVPRLVTSQAERWQAVLRRPDVRERPQPQVWSPLEYGCHVRDVYEVFRERVALMLERDDPLFPNWDQDATALERRYAEQRPDAVGPALSDGATLLAQQFADLSGPAWERTGRRSDGARFTVETLARYLLHDPAHHLWDVGAI